MKILERDAFLKDLKGWLREATTGEGRLVFIAGEAGIGKTVLLRIFAQTAEGIARVALGACDPLSTPRPLGPLLDVTGVLAAEARRLLEENATRGEVFRTFLNESGTVPTLVMFEDVQWADEATLDLLRFLGRRIGSTRALLIATYRDDEIGPRHPLTTVLGDLATAGAVRRMALPPLSESAVRTLAMGSGIDTADLYRQTGGNPFFVTEVLASGAPGIPATVRDAVLARASRLSPKGRTVLDIAAVIGVRVEGWLVAEVAGADADALDECASAGMLLPQGSILTFRHELARRAILEAIPPQRSLALHRRVLHALRTSTARDDLARLAHHAEAAGDRQAVLEYAPAAARRASHVRAHREAAAQLARALRFADGLPPGHVGHLLEEYARKLVLIDQLPAAIEARRQVLEIWRGLHDHLKEAKTLTHQALALVGAGQNSEAEQAITAALAILEPIGPGSQLAAAFRVRAHLFMLDHQLPDAIVWGEKAIAMAGRSNDVKTLIGGYNTVGSAMLCLGEEQRGVAHLKNSLQLAVESGFTGDAALAYTSLASSFADHYEFAQADQYLTEGIAYCVAHDIDYLRHYMVALQALSLVYRGQWADAGETAHAVAARPGTGAVTRIMALVTLGRLGARRGDPESSGMLDEALNVAAPTGTLRRLGPVRAARAEAAWLRGDREACSREAVAVYDLALSRRQTWLIGELAYWQWKAGTLASAPPGAARPFALQIEGRWEDASAEWRRLECPFEAAQALAEANDEGALRQALAEFERLGARPMAASVARRLREMGVRDIPRGSRPSTRAHPAHLTSREAEIIGHLGQGLRNREIAERMYISVKTVDHHISAVLSKLGVRTRTEAVREAARLGLLNDQGNGPPVNGGNGGRR